MDDLDALRIVSAEISKIPGPKRKTTTGMSIRCPFHKDNNPSCSLNLDPNLRHKGRKVPVGYFHCFACEEGRGNWNKLADKLGLKKLGDIDSESTFVKREIDDKVYEDGSHTIESIMEHWHCEEWYELHEDDEWRSFSGKFLQKFKALKTMDERGDHLMVLPVTIGRELVGAIKCRWQKKEGVLSYVNSPGHWTKEQGLWPYDYVRRQKPHTVWLVEGPRDAMRLLRYGIPTLSILGVQNWSDAKRDLIVALGVERVVLLTDGDSAGRNCYRTIRPTFKELLEVKVAKLTPYAKKLGLKKLDPFETPKKYLARLVKHYHLP